MKGKSALPGKGESKPKPKRNKGEGGGSPEATPKQTSAYRIFQETAKVDLNTKIGGKEGLSSTLRDNHQLTSKAELRGTGRVVLGTVADMWKAAPDMLKGDFERQADAVKAWEEELFAEQQQQQQPEEQKQRHTLNKDTAVVESQAAVAATKEAGDSDDDRSGDDMAMASTTSGSKHKSLVPYTESDDSEDDRLVVPSTADDCSEGTRLVPYAESDDSEEESLVPYADSDSEDDRLVTSTAGDSSEGKSLVPYADSDDSEDDPTMPSRSRNGCGRTGRTGEKADRRASHRPATSERAQTKERDPSVEKQRASKSVPMVSRFRFELFDVGNMEESSVDTAASSPVSTPSGTGRSHNESAPKTPDSSARGIPPSAEGKTPGPINERKTKAGDAQDSGESSARNAGCPPRTLEASPQAPAANSKTKTRKPRVCADRAICDAGKRAGLETVGAMSLKSRMQAAANKTPRKKSPGRRATSLDGRPAGSSSVSKASRKRRASVAAAQAETSPSEKTVASRAKVGKRAREAEASLPDGKPSVSKCRGPSRKSPTSPETTARAEQGVRSPTETKPNTAKGRKPIGGSVAGRKSAAAATETPKKPKRPKTPATRPVRSMDGRGGVGGKRNGGSPEERGDGGVTERDQADSGSGEETGSEASSEDTWPDLSSDEKEMEAKEDVRRDIEGKGLYGGIQGDGGVAGVAGGGHTAGSATRLTHKKKVWHAGRSAPSTYFGLIRQRDAKIEVLWEVERRPRGTKEKMWLPASVDLVDIVRMGDANVDGEPLWNIRYERHLSIPASKSQVAFLSSNKLRDIVEWDEEEKRWMGEPFFWRPKQGGA